MADPVTPEPDTDTDALRERVRERYAAAATATASGSTGDGCCRSDADSCCSTTGDLITPEQRAHFGQERYDATETAAVPEQAALASLGCGNPVAVAELHPGETVLDLGSGGGLDVLLSARRVGPAGLAYGLDMTEEMLALARRNQAEAGIENVRWLRGHIEAIPLPDRSVDVVISNCVINLSVDKPAALREAARVLRPGGRLAISDVIADADMDAETRADMEAYTGCIAGALTAPDFTGALHAAGLTDVTIEPTHRVHTAASAAIVRAVKPALS